MTIKNMHEHPQMTKAPANSVLFMGIIRGMLPLYLLMLINEKPHYGSEIMNKLSAMSGGFWKPSPGSIYPILKKFEEDGLVTVSFQNGSAATRKVYTITKAGSAELPGVQQGILDDLKVAGRIISQHITALDAMLTAGGNAYESRENGND